ncbi:MAG: GNAT family N-acetyltransferase [Tannerella sp.]|jgi:GNAT superfamily N-acetyltransferase|nr:GNAT family N-acetyltransferase [Tannerella sp.]
MEFRAARKEDIPVIMSIIGQAQASLKERGVEQWQNGYPTAEIELEDIAAGAAYVATDGGRVVAMISIYFNDEPTYDRIYEGAWLTEGQFMVAHRMAVANDCKRSGVAAFIFEQIEAICRNKGIYSFKADTHRDNIPMRTFLEKYGFSYCGIIYLLDGNERLAYEKILTKEYESER